MKRTIVGPVVLLVGWLFVDGTIAQTPTPQPKKPARVIDNETLFSSAPKRSDGMSVYENPSAGYSLIYSASASILPVKDADIALEIPATELVAVAYSMPFDLTVTAPTYRGEDSETSVETPLEPWKYLTTGQCNAAVRRLRTLLAPKSLMVLRRERLSNFNGAERYLIRLRMTPTFGGRTAPVEGSLMLCGSEKGIVGVLAVLPVERFKQSPAAIQSFLESVRLL